jgi:hypothetical protein
MMAIKTGSLASSLNQGVTAVNSKPADFNAGIENKNIKVDTLARDQLSISDAARELLTKDGNGSGNEPPAKLDGNGSGNEPPAKLDGNGSGNEPPAKLDGNGSGNEPPAKLDGNGSGNEPPAKLNGNGSGNEPP